jgi:hypothetical protein
VTLVAMADEDALRAVEESMVAATNEERAVAAADWDWLGAAFGAVADTAGLDAALSPLDARPLPPVEAVESVDSGHVWFLAVLDDMLLLPLRLLEEMVAAA